MLGTVVVVLGGCTGRELGGLAPTGPAAPARPAQPPMTFPPIELPSGSVPPVVLPPTTLPPIGSVPVFPATFPPIELPPATFPPLEPAEPTLPPPAGDAGMLRLTPQVVHDPAAENVPALVYLLPEGWQAEASVVWMHQWSRLAHLDTRIVDPATGIMIEWLPVQDFIWFQPPAGVQMPIGGNYQGKAFMPPVTDPVEFVRDFWMPGPLAHLSGATLVSVTPVPVVAEEFKRQFGGAADSSAYRLRYEYQLNGQAWEEDVFLALLYSGSPEILSWYVNFAYTVRAPKGVLDREQGVISTVIASRTTTPEWEGIYRLVQHLFRQGIAQQMADTVAFGRALAQYRAESQALQQQVVNERWASQDRIAELRRQSLGGVQNYVNPLNQVVVQLPTGWETYWTNAQGEYLVAGPDADLNQISSIWQQLQPQR